MRGKVYQFTSNYFNFQYTKQKRILHNEKIKQQCVRAQSKLDSEQNLFIYLFLRNTNSDTSGSQGDSMSLGFCCHSDPDRLS